MVVIHSLFRIMFWPFVRKNDIERKFIQILNSIRNIRDQPFLCAHSTVI